MASFNQKCPRCMTELEMDSAWNGMAVKCPICHNNVIVSASAAQTIGQQLPPMPPVNNFVPPPQLKGYIPARKSESEEKNNKTFVKRNIKKFVLLALVITGAICFFNSDYWGRQRKIAALEKQGVVWIDGEISCSELTNESGVLVIPDFVEVIKPEAFQNCRGLKEVILHENINFVGEKAFEGCDDLEKVTISSNIKKLPSGIFSGCVSLKSVKLPPALESVGSYAFSGCTGIESITIPENVKNIDAGAFENCTALESIVIPESVTEIANNAFSGCVSLKSVNLPPALKSIGRCAFSGCTGIENITIPENVKNIDVGVFENCTGLTKLSFAEGLTSLEIRDRAFKNCISLESGEFPAGVYRIGMEAFSGCVSLSETLIFHSGDISVGERAFKDCKKVKTVKIKSGRMAINAFSAGQGIHLYTGTLTFDYPFIKDASKEPEDYSFLESLTLMPKSSLYSGSPVVKKMKNLTIGDKAEWNWEYSDLPALENLIIGNDVRIEHGRFNNCAALKKVVIGSGVKIDKGAFKNCRNLTDITIHSDVDCGLVDWYLGYGNPFKFCENLTVLPGKKDMHRAFFAGIKTLRKVKVMPGVKVIGERAFVGCSGLTSVDLPDDLTSIGESAFQVGDLPEKTPPEVKMPEITLPANIQDIGQCAFLGIGKVVLPSGNPRYEIDSAGVLIDREKKTILYAPPHLTSYKIPQGVEIIGIGAFGNCCNLRNVEFYYTTGDGMYSDVKSVESSAFNRCDKLASVFIPEGTKVYRWGRTRRDLSFPKTTKIDVWRRKIKSR